MIKLARNQRGATAVEFALALPPFLILLFGSVQLAIIASARTGLQHAVDEGARYASIYPTPSDAQIIERVNTRRFGLDPAYVSAPVVSHGEQYGVPYIEISMRYARSLDFLLFQTPPLSLSYTRRAY